MTGPFGSPSSSGDPRYSAGAGGETADGRLVSPSAERNIPPITETLTGRLAGRTGRLLEIGSGTGQHAAHLALALPGITWIPSDPAERHRVSIAAWRMHLAPDNLRPPLALDATGDWAKDPAVAEAPLTAVFSANVIHIGPWAVAEGIIAGAARALAPDGLLIFYGPFMEGGAHTGEGNARFDASLKAQDPDWGIRDINELRTAAGQAFLDPDVIPMPSNNRMLVFQRAV
ncbi:MAG: DUF938 domain-containing protein [Pseudomonadota bacterium]